MKHLLALMTGVVAGFLLFSAVSSAGPALGCLDSRGCPDLVVIKRDLSQARVETRTFDASHCAVVEGMVAAGTRRLLLFDTAFPNQGPGSVIVGAPAAHPELFVFSSCHNHYHFNEYADYRLWTTDGYQAWTALRGANPDALAADLLAGNPGLASEMVAGAKRGFCMIDVTRVSSPKQADPRTYTNCATNQGISTGWADVYGASLDGQWIDVTGIAAGRYVLEVEVNAEHLLQESNYRNNWSSAEIRLR